MQTPFTSAAFRPDVAFTDAAERFFELLKSFRLPGAGPGAGGQDWSAVAGSLAGQFERWLKGANSASPWFAPAGFPGPGAGFGAAGAGALPQDAQRSWDLLARLAQLQSQLASYWSEIARDAAQRFVTRLGTAAVGAPTADNALKLYELWVNCAEESYATTVRKDEFCRLQAELANTSAALLLEQRRHAETLMRAFGLPSRNELDALYAQLKELRAQLAELSAAPAGGRAAKRPATAAARGRRRPRTRKPRA